MHMTEMDDEIFTVTINLLLLYSTEDFTQFWFTK